MPAARFSALSARLWHLRRSGYIVALFALAVHKLLAAPRRATGYGQRAASRRGLLLAGVLHAQARARVWLRFERLVAPRISAYNLECQALERVLLSYSSGAARNTILTLRLTCFCGGPRLARGAVRR